MNSISGILTFSIIILFLETVEIAYIFASLFFYKKEKVVANNKFLLELGNIERRKRILNDPDGTFFQQLNEAAKDNIERTPSHWIHALFLRLGIKDPVQKDFEVLKALVICILIAGFGGLLGAIRSGIPGSFLGFGVGFLLGQIFYYFQVSKRIRKRDATLDYWLIITAEQVFAAVIATYDLKTALESLEKMYLSRGISIPTTDIFLEVLAEHRNGKELAKAFIDIAHQCGHFPTMHLLLDFGRFNQYGTEITTPIMSMTDNLVERLPSSKNTLTPDAEDLAAIVKCVLTETRTGVEPIAAITQALRALPNSRMTKILEYMLNELRSGKDIYDVVSELSPIEGLPEFEIFLQGLLLSSGVGGRFSKILERITQMIQRRE